MLQTIRDYTQGWIAGTIVTIIILTFALWGIHSYFVGGGDNRVVAEVNGTDITKEQLGTAYERLRRQIQMQSELGNSIAAKDETALKDRALRGLIDVEVLRQAALNQGFRISDSQVDAYLESMPEFQVDGQFSLDRFQRILSSSMLSTSEFLELLRSSLLINQPKLGIVLSSFALPNETDYAIALINQERDIDYINIPLQYFLSQPFTISADKINSYYKEHEKEFMTPEQVQVDYIELSLKDLAAQIKPSDEALQNYYTENSNSYIQPAQWKLVSVDIPVAANASPEDKTKAQKKAESILQQLKKGADVSKTAQGFSGGLNGQTWLSLNQLPAQLQKDVSELLKPGQITGLIKTDKGYTIIKALDIKGPHTQSFADVKDKVKQTYARREAEEKFAEMREQLADLTYEHPDSLQTASQKLKLPIKTSGLFSKEKPANDVSQNSKVRNIAFSNDVINLQNNSDVIQLNPETAVVLHIKRHNAPTLMPLAVVSKQIEAKLKLQEAESRARKFTDELKTKLQAGADPVLLAATNKLIWNKAGYLPRYSTKVDPAILDLVFRLPNPAMLQNKPVYSQAHLPSGYAIVVLKSVKQGTADDKQYAVFAEQVQDSQGLLEYELYKMSLINNAKVSVR